MMLDGQSYRGRFEHKEPKKALNEIERSLEQLRFRREKRSDYLLSMKGPDMRSTKQPALLGITSIDVHADSGILKVDACISEQGKLLRLVLAMIFVPAVITTLVLSVLGYDFVSMVVALVLLVNIVIWLMLTPLFVGLHRKHTVRELETLLGNVGK